MIWGKQLQCQKQNIQSDFKWCNFGGPYLGNNNYRTEDFNVYFMEMYRKMRTPTQMML